VGARSKVAVVVTAGVAAAAAAGLMAALTTRVTIETDHDTHSRVVLSASCLDPSTARVSIDTTGTSFRAFAYLADAVTVSIVDPIHPIACAGSWMQVVALNAAGQVLSDAVVPVAAANGPVRTVVPLRAPMLAGQVASYAIAITATSPARPACDRPYIWRATPATVLLTRVPNATGYRLRAHGSAWTSPTSTGPAIGLGRMSDGRYDLQAQAWVDGRWGPLTPTGQLVVDVRAGKVRVLTAPTTPAWTSPPASPAGRR
jgi:hypothetical protein